MLAGDPYYLDGCEWVPDAKHQTFYTVEFWDGFDCDCSCPGSSLLEEERI